MMCFVILWAEFMTILAAAARSGHLSEKPETGVDRGQSDESPGSKPVL